MAILKIILIYQNNNYLQFTFAHGSLKLYSKIYVFQSPDIINLYSFYEYHIKSDYI